MFYTELRLWHKVEVDIFLVSFSEFHYWVFLHTCLPASSSLPTVLSVYLLLCTRSGLEISGVRQNYFVKIIAWMYESPRTCWDILQSWDQEKNKGPIFCPRPGELLKPSFFLGRDVLPLWEDAHDVASPISCTLSYLQGTMSMFPSSSTQNTPIPVTPGMTRFSFL